MGNIVETAAPVGYPVTIEQARAQCALYDETAHDTLLTQLIAAATAEVEDFTGAKIMARTVQLDLDGFQCRDIDLQIYPVQSITSVKYDEPAGTEQTVPTADYYQALTGMNPRLRSVGYWPATLVNKPGSVRVLCVVGYEGTGDSPISRENIPANLTQAILMRVYEMWNDPSVEASTDKGLAQPSRRYN